MADRDQRVVVSPEAPFVCPECHLALQSVRGFNWARLLLAVTVILAAGAAVRLFRESASGRRPGSSGGASGGSVAAPTAPGNTRQPLTIPKTKLPLRVLTRPLATIFREPADSAAKVQENVPSFSAFFVYSRIPGPKAKAAAGWYEVGGDLKGSSAGSLGWMKAEDVIEWKQAMVAEYAPLDNRKPVLMFGDRAHVEKLLKSSDAERTGQADEFYRAIDSQQMPAGFPVLCMEPKRAADESFLLPILDFTPAGPEDREGRLFQIAAVARSSGTPPLDNPEHRSQAGQSSDLARQAQKALKLDLVFVMDLTSSMEPFLNATVDLIRKVAIQAAEQPELKAGLRFGFWGYRDSMEIKGIEFTTRNFTPSLQAATEFVETIKQVRITIVDSVDYPEDVFSGVKDGITKTAWTDGALRFLILVGDAPSHELGHKWNASGMDEHDLRTLATESNVLVAAFHLKDPDFPVEQAVAERQFTVLAENPGTGEGHPAYFQVRAYEGAAYEKAAEAFLTPVIEAFRQAQNAASAQAAPDAKTDKPAGAQQDSVPAKALTGHILRGAVVEWLGKRDATQVPRDATAWVSDKDLVNPAVQALDVKALLTKNQLDSLQTALEQIREAGLRGQSGGKDFFDSLRASVAVTAGDSGRVRKAQSLTELGLVPAFLASLPYQSRIMVMTKSTWNGMSSDQQGTFLKQLESKISFYKAIRNNPDQWQPPHQSADPDEYLAAIPLVELP